MSKNYTIALSGLAPGEHHFEFALANDLFRLHETSPLLSGKGVADVTLVRHAHHIHLVVELDAEVQVECDRCMDPYAEFIEFDGEAVVREGEPNDEQDEVLWVEQGATELDLSQWLYESVVLSLPIQRIHPDLADCNQEVTKYIQE